MVSGGSGGLSVMVCGLCDCLESENLRKMGYSAGVERYAGGFKYHRLDECSSQSNIIFEWGKFKCHQRDH